MAVRLCKKKKSYLVGILAIILATFSTTIHRTTLEYVNTYAKSLSINFTSAQYVFLQSVVQLVIISIVLIFYRTNPFVLAENWKQVMILLTAGVSKTLGLVLMYEAFRSIDMGIYNIFASFSMFSTIVFTRTLLRDTDEVACTLDILAIVSVMGVAAIVEPDIALYYHRLMLQVETGKPFLKYAAIVFAGVICDGLSLVLSRAIAVKIDYRCAMFYPSLVGSIILPIYLAATRTSFILGELPDLEWCLVLLSTIFAAIAFYLIVYGLLKITAVTTALLLTLQILWVYGFEVLYGNLAISPISILGVILMVIAGILTLMIQIYDWHLPSLVDNC